MSWIDGITNKIDFVVRSERIDDNLIDFPLLVHLSEDCGTNSFDASVVFETMGSDANRKKIAVTTASGVQCYVEIERWSQLDKEVWLWVKIPEISSVQDTPLSFYYEPTTSGNTDYVGDIGDTSAQSVWDSNFVGVWHMSQSPVSATYTPIFAKVESGVSSEIDIGTPVVTNRYVVSGYRMYGWNLYGSTTGAYTGEEVLLHALIDHADNTFTDEVYGFANLMAYRYYKLEYAGGYAAGVYISAGTELTFAPIIDSTNNGKMGMSHGSMSSVDLIGGKTGNALDFDGSSDYVGFGNSSYFDFGTDDVTMEFIFKHATLITGAILSRWDDAGGSPWGYEVLLSSDGRLRFYGDNVLAVDVPAGNVVTDQWYIYTYSRSGNTSKAYLDGDTIDTNTSFSETLSAGGASVMSVGARGDGPNTFTSCTIDEFRMSGVTRSAAWVKATYYSNWDNIIAHEVALPEPDWLGTWNKRIKLTVDHTKVDNTLLDFPLLVTLASGTGITNSDVTDVFDDLTVTSSGVVDSYTKLLLHMDGDSSASQHVITVNGDPDLYTSTTSSGMIGSMYFDGTNDYIDAPVNNDWIFGTDDFTIDYWVYTEKHGVYYVGWYDGSVWFSYSSLSVIGYIPSTGKQTFRIGGPDDELVSTTTIPLSAWTHIAVSRSGTAFRLFINGTVEDSFTSSASINNPNCAFMLGKFDIASFVPTEFLQGYMSELRISKGTARWTSNFTPPSAPYELDSYTKLLLHFEGDKSAGQHAVTFNGNPQMYASQGKFDGSYNFDGTGDYLNLTVSDDWNFGSGAFTIDGWFYASVDAERMLFMTGYDTTKRGLLFRRLADGSINLYYSTDGASWTGNTTTAASLMSTGSWYHIALIKDDGTVPIKIYVNGTLEAQTGDVSSIAHDVNYDFHIGAYFLSGVFSTNVIPWEGYMDEFRISKGIARWTENFDPPETPYPEYTWVVSGNKKKIAITTEDGTTQCPVEIEKWNAYDEQAWLWAKAPILYPDRDTHFYLYYDKNQVDNTNVGVPGDTVSTTVWSNNYNGVWHLFESPTGITSDTKNSANNLHGTSQSMESTDLTTGLVGDGLIFGGTNEYISVADNALVEVGDYDRFTLTWTFKDSGITNENCMVGKPNATTGFHCDIRNGQLAFAMWTSSWSAYITSKSTAIYGDSNYHVVNVVVNRTNNTVDLYVDGQEVTYTIHSNATGGFDKDSDITNAETFRIGRSYSAAVTEYFIGSLDEFRLSVDAKTPAWIKVDSYSTWNTLLTMGTTEIEPAEVPDNYYYFGYVTEAEVPVARRVLIYDRNTGTLMGSTTSNASDGYYYLTTTISGEHFVVALDDDAGEDYNALVSDRLEPKGIE